MARCEYCNKIIKEIIRDGRFCSIRCARKYAINHIKKGAISEGLKRYWKTHKKHHSIERICEYCHTKYSSDTSEITRQYCSTKCAAKVNGSIGGLHSSQNNTRRSKNEKYFAQLCKKHFKNVECNKAIFFGYDADVIIHDIKVAVMWNGKWHYKQLRENQPLQKIRKRDKLKIKMIKKYGYKPYVIKDMGKYNRKFVLSRFREFITVTEY